MKKIIILSIAMLFGTFCFAQNLNEMEKDIKKSFFKGEKVECVKVDDLNKVAIYKSGETYYAVSIGTSQNYTMSQDKATFGFRNWVAQNFGEIKTTSSGKTMVEATISFTFPSSSEFLKEDGKYTCLVLYKIPGQIQVNGKPIDVNKIL